MSSREKKQINDRANHVRRAMAVRGDKSSADLRRRLGTTQSLAYDLWCGKTRQPRPETVRLFRSAYGVDPDFFTRPPFTKQKAEAEAEIKGEAEETTNEWPHLGSLPFGGPTPSARTGSPNFDAGATLQVWIASLARSIHQLRAALDWIERDMMKVFDIPGLEPSRPSPEELRWLRRQFLQSKKEENDTPSSADDVEDNSSAA